MINSRYLVPRPGIEPGWIAPLVFETSASTDSAIWAFVSYLTGAKLVIFFISDKSWTENRGKIC